MVQKMAVPRRTVRDLRGMGFKKTHFRIDPLIRMGLQAPAGKAEIWKPEPVAFRGVSSYWNDDEMPRSLMPPRPPSDPRLRNKPSFFDNLKRRVKEEQEAKKKKKEEEEKEKAEKESQAAKEEEEKRKAKAKRARVQSEVYVKEEVSESSGKSKTKWVRVKCELYIESEDEETQEESIKMDDTGKNKDAGRVEEMHSSAANRRTKQRQSSRDRSDYHRRRRQQQQQQQQNNNNCNNHYYY